MIKDFGDGNERNRVLQDIDLTLAAGELTLLVGPSGCGKTTLVSIIAGILSPSEGNVELFGTRLTSLSRNALVDFRLREVGFIFQQFNLLPTLTAAENAGLAIAAAGASRKAATAAGAAMLAQLGMATKVNLLPAQLSGGEQQRVAIARALAPGPRLVVCDEPTSALDAASGHAVMKLLRALAVRPGRAVIVVTHDSRVHEFADRIIEMEDGRLVTTLVNQLPTEHMSTKDDTK
ncbi:MULTISPECIES: ABC transporter ATP-binding protein [unclassified Janthinobacterium]|uniref:ABC transporter ATP-binding protein n=1 Tax=unclassified Janthinobacterium TaxID=2610881 RepID=UPI0018CA4148|nr:ABC transporter ATP-binding protein [Janthinobacterium sp. CG_23.4]MDH6159692.1 putative ABC transport system ATP-binding protein [Janthinobacterium sp. CG_23.4]